MTPAATSDTAREAAVEVASAQAATSSSQVRLGWLGFGLSMAL